LTERRAGKRHHLRRPQCNPDVTMKEMAMTIRDDLNFWRNKFERSCEGLMFAAVSLFVLAGVLAKCVQPVLVAF
jgi:hypothetical protein